MSELKFFGYMILAVLCAAIIIVPLVEVFFAYRERLMLSDALYNSCRVAAEATSNYRNMRTIDTVYYIGSYSYADDFLDVFANTFAISFDLDIKERYLTGRSLDSSSYKLVFRPQPNNETYNDFVLALDFNEKYDSSDEKTTTTIVVVAESDYKFKYGYMQYLYTERGLLRTDEGNSYKLRGNKIFEMIITN